MLWTCFEADAGDLRVELLPGDLITWSDPSGLRDPLALRILALMGRGSHAAGPVPEATPGPDT